MKILARTPRNRAAGFTLIELMIAIAIIGVLAAIAVPAFSNYLARARVSEAINYAQTCKTGYLEFYATKGTLPASVNDANCPDLKTTNVEKVTVGGTPAAIRVQLTTGSVLPQAVKGHIIILQPLNASGKPVAAGDVIQNWNCAIQTADSGAAAQTALDLVPAICRGAVVAS